MTKAPLFTAAGQRSGEQTLPAALFDAPGGGAVVHQAVTAALANSRLGTASTLNRSRIAGGGAKPWRQKGTGRARAGSIRSPLWRHGAVVFGPNGRVYDQRLPRKMRRIALAAALTAAARDGRVVVVQSFAIDADRPRTKQARELLEKMGLEGDVVLVTAQADAAVARATANLPAVETRTAATLRLTDVLTADRLVFAADALPALEGSRS